MEKSYFTRSNVNEETLQISNPRRSSFDLYHEHNLTIPLGQYIACDVTPLMPGEVISGSVSPDFALENIQTPQIGPLRLDTHSFVISANRMNRDWKYLIEGKSDSKNLQPQFNVATFFDRFLFKVLGQHEFEYFWEIVAVSGKYYISLDKFYLEYVSGLDRLADDNENTPWGYLGDRMDILTKRFRQFVARYSSDPDPSVIDLGRLNPRVAAEIIFYAIEPFFGDSSVFAHLGYPCYSYYGPAFQAFLGNLPTDDSVEQSVLTAIKEVGTWSNLFRCYQPGAMLSHQYSELPHYLVNEMFIRAPYCAWYDGLRNWHVEDREHLPDPDEWGMQSVLMQSTESASPWVAACLILPRFRTWGKDLVTTIQTDGAWRHIFSPIMNGGVSDDFRSYYSSLATDSGLEDHINHLLIDGYKLVFPQGLFRRDSSDNSQSDLYMQDLVTMRRSGMLERYAAHDYYCPDTYVGQLYAHWRAQPIDLLPHAAKYIGGSENFISGEQIKSQAGTEETPQGSRTFVGGASASGGLSYAAAGDFLYVVTFVSLQPVPVYDAKNPHLYELTRADLPFEEFADDTRVQIRTMDLLRGFEHNDSYIGYVPRYIQWRGSLDTVSGKFLREYRNYLWLRDWYSEKGIDVTAYSMHVVVAPDAWLDKAIWDDVAFGKVTFNYAVDAPLPAAVEIL